MQNIDFEKTCFFYANNVLLIIEFNFNDMNLAKQDIFKMFYESDYIEYNENEQSEHSYFSLHKFVDGVNLPLYQFNKKSCTKKRKKSDDNPYFINIFVGELTLDFFDLKDESKKNMLNKVKAYNLDEDEEFQFIEYEFLSLLISKNFFQDEDKKFELIKLFKKDIHARYKYF